MTNPAAAANLLGRELDSDQKGSFVYQILQRVRPLEYPSPSSPHASLGSSTTNGFHRGDLVSIDVVRRGRLDSYHNDVTYLRLSDGSGWIPDSMNLPSSGSSSAVVLAKEVPVEVGLWTLYVDNCPRGQSLRHHPLDSPDTIVRLGGGSGGIGGGGGVGSGTRHPLLGCSSLDGDDIHDAHHEGDNEDDNDGHPVFYETMVKVHCDRKVVSPTTFVAYYRVQSVNKWLMDRRVVRNPDSAAVVANAGPAILFTQMLIDASHVRSGIFCFQAVENVLVRSRSSVDESAGTSHKVRKGTLVSVDIIKESLDPLNGPYLRLSDGSGWLFVQKNGVPMMKQVSVQPGLWELRVFVSEGMTLQRHPMEASSDPKKQVGTTYNEHSFPKDSLVQATYRVRVLNPNHDSTFHEFHAEDEPHTFIYYRVHGTAGWLADRHHSGTRALKVLTEDVDTMASVPDHAEGWTPEFVRGVASTVPTLREASYTPSSCNPVLVFSTVPMRKSDDDDGIRRVVYCATRTVGIMFDGNASSSTPNGASVEDRNDNTEGGDDGNVEPMAPARWYRNCTPKELWEHLRKDAIEIMMEPVGSEDEEDEKDSKRKAAEKALENDEASNRDELNLRRQLLELDAKVEAAELKRKEIVDTLRGYDEKRLQDAARMRCLMDERRRACDTTLETGKVGAASSKLKDSKQLESREEGGIKVDLDEERPEVLDLASSASTTSSESTTESIHDGNKKQQHGHKCRSADAASPLPPALSTSPRSRRVERAISVDRVSWHDEQGIKTRTSAHSKGSSSRGTSTNNKPRARRENSAERESYRNRIEELLRMRTAETEGAAGSGRTSTLLSILSPEIDESIDEDSNTLVSDSGQSYDSESDDLSAEYDSY